MLCSQGVPMLLAGDEFLRTQKGNNNAWCQDNPTSWLDWAAAGEQEALIDFVAALCWLRRGHPAFAAGSSSAAPLSSPAPATT